VCKRALDTIAVMPRLRLTFALLTVVAVSACTSITPITTTPAPTSGPVATARTTPAAQTQAAQTPSPTTPSASSPTSPSSKPSASVFPDHSGRPGSSPSGRPSFASVDDAYRQTVEWQTCQTSIAATCATVYVPTDYEQPNAGTTAIAVARFGSTQGSQGDLFINPGGPGAGGIGFAAYLAQSAPGLASNYNLIGFDPRGTGSSDPLECLDAHAFDVLNAFDPTPETPEERQMGIDLVDAQGEACKANSGLLAAHVTTIETARDIDVMRAVLSDEKLNYFGFSYGTFLGTTYAALFPDKVGRMVLDGALEPGLSSMQVGAVQNEGVETELDAYVASCVNGTQPCPLGATTDNAKGELRKLLVNVDNTPLPTADGTRPLDQALAFTGIVDTLYSPSSWVRLTDALRAAESGNGQPLLTLADDYLGRTSSGYASNELQANQAINCLDEQVAGGPTTGSEADFLKDSPIAGDIMYGLADRGCGDWPLKSTLTPPDYSAPGTPKILVVGTTRDPATPYVWAQQLAQTLSNAVLLTRDGDGHTAYISGNRCIISAVDVFFADGTVPPGGTTC
jgi:pimeloyl-ACP methyl ester carboxylesterase